MSERLEEIKSHEKEIYYLLGNERTRRYWDWLVQQVDHAEELKKEHKRMEAKTISLIKQSKYYKRSLERMKRHYEIQLQAYGDRHMATYNFERYDEVRDFIHRIEEILEGFK